MSLVLNNRALNHAQSSNLMFGSILQDKLKVYEEGGDKKSN